MAYDMCSLPIPNSKNCLSRQSYFSFLEIDLTVNNAEENRIFRISNNCRLKKNPTISVTTIRNFLRQEKLVRARSLLFPRFLRVKISRNTNKKADRPDHVINRVVRAVIMAQSPCKNQQSLHRPLKTPV